MKHTTQFDCDASLLNGVSIDPPKIDPAHRPLYRHADLWKRLLIAGSLVLVMVLMLPGRAHAQFLDIFGAIDGEIQGDMGTSLAAINQIAGDMQKLYQVTVWPLAAINQARGFVANTITGYRGAMSHIYTIPIESATLPGTPAAESLLHSGQSSEIPALQSSFVTNFGAIPQANAASSQERIVMDTDDAFAQQSLKTTLIADQGDSILLQTADSMENQVALATPGSTPFLTAEAQVANLRCQAFIQKMLAAQLREEAGRLAQDNMQVKREASMTSNLTSLVSGALTTK